MKLKQVLLIQFSLLFAHTSFSQSKLTAMSVFDFQIQSISGEMIDFSDYKGKKIMIVNTASECGYTPQYEDLQLVHENFSNKVQVLGFPANNFGGQEPGTDQQISLFCEKKYGVDFPLFSKMDVVGENQHPLFKWLAEKAGKEPNWNFCKYLVSEDGKEVSFYPSSVNPGEIAEKL